MDRIHGTKITLKHHLKPIISFQNLTFISHKLLDIHQQQAADEWNY